MNRFIRELRRRKVFASLGLYVGISWLAIQSSSIILPAFEAPAWILRTLIIAAVTGFPVVAVIAWFYNLTTHGLEHDAGDERSAVPAFGARRADFAVIGILAVALAFSVYLNIASDPAPPPAVEPVSALIADFDNTTDEQVFDGVLEQLMTMGLEAAPYVALLDRNQAADSAKEVDPDAEGLPGATAQLVAVREGVGVLLSGSIAPVGRGYRVTMSGLDPLTGNRDFAVSVDAADRDAVPGAVASLARRVREALGDALGEVDPASYRGERVGATSLEAAKAYANAISAAYEGDPDAAIEFYRRATELQPDWGLAYGAWAIAEHYRGRPERAEALWETAMSHADTMSDSSRLFTLGSYFFVIRQDYENAREAFEEFVEKYPANSAGRNNLAVMLFNTLNFDRAASEGKKLVELFPGSRLYRTNLALYSMYAGDFDGAASEARTVIEDDDGYGPAYLPLAIESLERGDTDAALGFYRLMDDAPRGFLGRGVPTIGLADAYLSQGRFQPARDILVARIGQNRDERNTGTAQLQVVLAESFVASGDDAAAVAAARAAAALSSQRAIKVAAALVFVATGELEAAQAIADELGAELPAHGRAYAQTIEAAILRESGRGIDAITMLRSALEIADLWRIHWELGRAYLDTGYFAEALAEFERCQERRGEAVAMFLDDAPTYRYLAELPYWTARAQSGLGAQSAAAAGYRRFIASRPEGGRFVDDAQSRLTALDGGQ